MSDVFLSNVREDVTVGTSPARVSLVFGLIVLSALVACGVNPDREEEIAGGSEAESQVERSPDLVPASSDLQAVMFRPDMAYLPDDPLLGFVEIPAGPFLVGSDRVKDQDADPNEEWNTDTSQGTLQLSTYYIGKYEVTVAQYQACVDDGGCNPGDRDNLDGPAWFPIRYVSWHEALEYCDWLERTLTVSSQVPDELRRRLTDGWQISLPSEAEWEKAARGTDGRIYPWGDDVGSGRANHAGSDFGEPTPVGSFPRGASPYGTLDMSGNVWEWTRSLLRDYPYDPDDGRESLEAGGARVVRGGSFGTDRGNVRAAFRGGDDPVFPYIDVGFRVVVSGS